MLIDEKEEEEEMINERTLFANNRHGIERSEESISFRHLETLSKVSLDVISNTIIAA